MNVECKETLRMNLLKMCNIRTTNIIISVQFLLSHKRAKDSRCNYSPPSEAAYPACGLCLVITLKGKVSLFFFPMLVVSTDRATRIVNAVWTHLLP
jgi:hypothetical protein